MLILRPWNDTRRSMDDIPCGLSRYANILKAHALFYRARPICLTRNAVLARYSSIMIAEVKTRKKQRLLFVVQAGGEKSSREGSGSKATTKIIQIVYNL